MGYTHYWSFRDVAHGDKLKVLKAYNKAIAECTKIAKAYNASAESWNRLSGFTAHAEPGLYQGLAINGKQDLAHEEFTLRERYELNRKFNFCKTAGKPYDVVVTACLIVLKYRLKEYIGISSDGETDDWAEGLELAKQTLGLKSLTYPKEIRFSLVSICSECGQRKASK